MYFVSKIKKKVKRENNKDVNSIYVFVYIKRQV